jgi:hypothetical protein
MPPFLHCTLCSVKRADSPIHVCTLPTQPNKNLNLSSSSSLAWIPWVCSSLLYRTISLPLPPACSQYHQHHHRTLHQFFHPSSQTIIRPLRTIISNSLILPSSHTIISPPSVLLIPSLAEHPSSTLHYQPPFLNPFSYQPFCHLLFTISSCFSILFPFPLPLPLPALLPSSLSRLQSSLIFIQASFHPSIFHNLEHLGIKNLNLES